MTDNAPSDASAPAEVRRALETLEAAVRSLVGDSAVLEREAYAQGRILGLFVRPVRPRAREVSILTEQWLVVQVGNIGGCWELGYTDDDVRFACDLIEAAVAGRVSERTAWRRSRVTAVLADGRAVSQTGYDGCLTALLPLPGWARWGSLERYEPYLPEDGPPSSAGPTQEVR